MKTSMKFFNNDEGVSPIVATLVLIVVAIIGAAAVGLIMGTFSSQVSDQANAGDIAQLLLARSPSAAALLFSPVTYLSRRLT